MNAATLALVHKPPSLRGSCRRTRSFARTSGVPPCRRAVAPTQIAQRIWPFHIVANDELFDPTPTERGHLGDVSDTVTLGEKPDRLKMPTLHNVGARNIPITQRFDAQMRGYCRHGSPHRDSWRRSLTASIPQRNPAAASQSAGNRITRTFGDGLHDARDAMASLAGAHEPQELASIAYRLYEEFRPAIPSGVGGWGAKGRLDLDRIRAMAGDVG